MSQYARTAKNLVLNYSRAQVRVRDATSNDPWGPSSTVLAEISTLSRDRTSLQEILVILLKRLNDKGKNWRHVYKSLIVLEYLALTGEPKLHNYLLKNRHLIDTLKSFQYVDKEGRDFGHNVREKAKSFCTLLDKPEEFQEAQKKALSIASQSNQYGYVKSDASFATHVPSKNVSDDFRRALPKNSQDEEEQLRKAIALSKTNFPSQADFQSSNRNMNQGVPRIRHPSIKNDTFVETKTKEQFDLLTFGEVGPTAQTRPASQVPNQSSMNDQLLFYPQPNLNQSQIYNARAMGSDSNIFNQPTNQPQPQAHQALSTSHLTNMKEEPLNNPLQAERFESNNSDNLRSLADNLFETGSNNPFASNDSLRPNTGVKLNDLVARTQSTCNFGSQNFQQPTYSNSPFGLQSTPMGYQQAQPQANSQGMFNAQQQYSNPQMKQQMFQQNFQPFQQNQMFQNQNPNQARQNQPF